MFLSFLLIITANIKVLTKGKINGYINAIKNWNKHDKERD